MKKVTKKQLSELQTEMQKSFPELQGEIKNEQLILRAKGLTLDARRLRQLADISEGYNINFSRSGANFRTILS